MRDIKLQACLMENIFLCRNFQPMKSYGIRKSAYVHAFLFSADNKWLR